MYMCMCELYYCELSGAYFICRQTTEKTTEPDISSIGSEVIDLTNNYMSSCSSDISDTGKQDITCLRRSASTGNNCPATGA